MNDDATRDYGHALDWALDVVEEPAMASANWLATDLDPDRRSAVALLTDPEVSLAVLRRAKNAFKTMRIVGETSRDRRTGARLYAAALAAALVRHRTRISRQSVAAMQRAFRSLLDDPEMPGPLRDLAGAALAALVHGGSPAGGDGIAESAATSDGG